MAEKITKAWDMRSGWRVSRYGRYSRFWIVLRRMIILEGERAAGRMGNVTCARVS